MTDIKPNIVLLIADQWRWDCMGILGHPVVETPNLDNIFAKGTIFTQAYSAVPSCIAARTALLTGLSQKSHGRVGYKDCITWNYPITLPGLLADAGYHTHCAGKMHVYPPRSLMGFHSVDLHDGYLRKERNRNKDYELVDDYLLWFRKKCGQDVDLTDSGLGCNGYSVRPWPYEERFHPSNWVTSQAIDFLRKRDITKPFFLKVSYHRPHPPLDPPQYYLNRYLNKELFPVNIGNWAKKEILPDRGLVHPVPNSPEQVDLARKAYFAQLTHIDCQVNRLIHALYEYKVMQNTLILFVSDHGEMLYDHNMVAKGRPYSASARIPFMIRFPDSWEKTARPRVEEPVELCDILPTCLDAAGIAVPSSIEGSSVLPLCGAEKHNWRKYIHGEHSLANGKSNHWITDGKKLYVWYSETGKEQFFDIIKDPNNLYNVIEDNKNTVTVLRNKLIEKLSDREEGYVKNGKLVKGCKSQCLLKKFLNKK